jgi:hypothetical protein
MYFTSSSREEGILTSPYMVATSGGCLYFYYNMEGGPSVELKVMTFVLHQLVVGQSVPITPLKLKVRTR